MTDPRTQTRELRRLKREWVTGWQTTPLMIIVAVSILGWKQAATWWLVFSIVGLLSWELLLWWANRKAQR